MLENPTAIAKSALTSMSASNLFLLEDASVSFGEIEALKSIQLSIERGEFVFLTGVSGSGKTTLLRLLAQELFPVSGKVKINYRAFGRKTLFISRIFQDLRLLPEESCEDNLWMAYDSSVYRSQKEFRQDLQELCRFFGITDRMHLKIHDANGGLKQKVAIIRALLCRPDCILADEPTSSLDGNNAQKIFEILNLYNLKKGLTVVWASHNGDLVKRFTGRVIHLDGGRLVYSGNACFI